MDRDDLIRFVTNEKHAPYGHRTGVLRGAFALWEERLLGDTDYEELDHLLDWFNKHLPKPSRLSVSKHPRAKGSAISWLRSSAHEYVSRMRRVAQLVQAAGIAVEEIRTDRPGYIVYEDEHQVIALPFADTPI